MTNIILIGTLLVAAGVAYLLVIVLRRLYETSALLRLQAEVMKQEKISILLQKEVALKEMAFQSMKLEKAAVLAHNSIEAMKIVAGRATDPEWAKDFEQGRNQAQWN